MNLFSDIRVLVISALEAMVAEGVLPSGLDFSAVAVEPPRDALHGDMATNAAMVLSKPAGIVPRTIAEDLAPRLMADGRVAATNTRSGTVSIFRDGRLEHSFGAYGSGEGEFVRPHDIDASPDRIPVGCFAVTLQL